LYYPNIYGIAWFLDQNQQAPSAPPAIHFWPVRRCGHRPTEAQIALVALTYVLDKNKPLVSPAPE
jgi:hypothetical protein